MGLDTVGMSEIEKENRKLKQLLVDADEVARRRGDVFGLCDSIHSREGEAYPSHAMGEALEKCKEEGFRPLLTYDEAKAEGNHPNSPWHEAL
ncbi:MAG TPA: hypothetical protein VGB77_21555 [Abditibacteriaceae bacterium]|jgi:bifunctional pyridoxal-dependent enzyme with beta-cystathionase and maltose regulon repressor activities